MYTLSEETKLGITKDTGINFDDIEDMDFDEIDKRIEKKIGKKICFKKNSNTMFARGSVYLSLNKWFEFGVKK